MLCLSDSCEGECIYLMAVKSSLLVLAPIAFGEFSEDDQKSHPQSPSGSQSFYFEVATL